MGPSRRHVRHLARACLRIAVGGTLLLLGLDTLLPLAARPPVAEAQAALTVAAVAGGFDQPTFVTHAGDGSRRLFVLERTGRIKVVDGGPALLFLDVSGLVSTGCEQGLLGLAFHPGHATNGLFYVFYTASDYALTVARYRVSAGDRNRADAASAQVLLSVPHPGNCNHNGGMLAFGPDGYLYAGTGDGGSAGDPPNNAQNLGVLLGKLLRVDVDDADPGRTYHVPSDNPFAGVPGARPEVWALGLRNPWRFSFDRGTGDLWIGDVGQGSWEEIDRPTSRSGGENYQWKCMEGLHPYSTDVSCTQGRSTPPIFEYGHGTGDCAITGGYVYRGAAVPALAGAYVYGDYCSGRIWALRPGPTGAWLPSLLLDLPFFVDSFGEDEAGEVYLASNSNGTIYRLASPAAPTATPTPPPAATAMPPTATPTPPPRNGDAADGHPHPAAAERRPRRPPPPRGPRRPRSPRRRGRWRPCRTCSSLR